MIDLMMIICKIVRGRMEWTGNGVRGKRRKEMEWSEKWRGKRGGEVRME